MLDHEPITFREFLGTFNRGEDDSVPPGYFRSSRNVKFLTGGVESREGTTLDITLGSVVRAAVYKRIGEAQRLLLLDATGKLYDSTNLVTPILDIAAMTDFSVETMFNRAYITPHNGVTGLPGEKVYVYEGAGLARPAAGTAPSGFSLVAADSAASGSCETGVHAFGVCFETSSGHLTPPGGFIQFSPAGNKKVDLSNIPVGPAGTAARQIVCTKEIIGFNGDFNNQEYFIVPGGRIAGNVSTVVSVSFFDADLVASADYLLDQLTEIPAGVGIRNYRGHLCVWGENVSPAVVRVSKAGNPESHDSVEGYLTVNPGDSGGGVLNCAVYRTQLLMFKEERTYVTQDNGQNAAFWEVPDPIDTSIGSFCHGVARVRDYGDNLEDRLFIAARPGFYLFDGSFADKMLSYDFDGVWARITKTAFHTIETVIDPVEARIYIAVPLDGVTTPNTVLVCDYQEGMAPDSVKWTAWTFPNDPTTILVDVINATKTSTFKFGSRTGNVYKLDPNATNDYNNAFPSYVQFGHLPVDDDEKIWHFTGVRLRVRGVGALDITVSSEDDSYSIQAQSLLLSTPAGRALFGGFDFTHERASVKLGVDGVDEHFRLTNFTLYLKVEWDQRPE